MHAHPDDETLTTGVTMAAYAAVGHDVHVLTCTLGEEGEVIPPALAYLSADREDILGSWRREELRAAMLVLGVSHAVLGEGRGVASRYRDSGMAGTPSATRPDAFARADVEEAAVMVAAHIRALRPDVVVTYDKHGGYAHPDHIQTHRVTMKALVMLAAEAQADAATVAGPLVYAIATPQSWAVQDRAWLNDHVPPKDSDCTLLQANAPYPPSVVSDELVTHSVDGPGPAAIQRRALSWHATQVTLHDGYYALSNHIAVRLGGREGFARLDPSSGELVAAARGTTRHTGLLVSPQGQR